MDGGLLKLLEEPLELLVFLLKDVPQILQPLCDLLLDLKLRVELGLARGERGVVHLGEGHFLGQPLLLHFWQFATASLLLRIPLHDEVQFWSSRSVQVLGVASWLIVDLAEGTDSLNLAPSLKQSSLLLVFSSHWVVM